MKKQNIAWRGFVRKGKEPDALIYDGPGGKTVERPHGGVCDPPRLIFTDDLIVSQTETNEEENMSATPEELRRAAEIAETAANRASEAYQPDPEEKLIGYVVYARNNGDWFRSRSLPKTYGTAAEAQRDIDELKRCGLTQTVREVRPLYSVPK